MKTSLKSGRLPLFFSLVFIGACSGTQGTPVATDMQAPSRVVDVPANPDREAYFGELHIHTAQSFDSFTMGVRTSLEDAYRFARGDEIEYLGRTVARGRPLDFIAVTDHAEQMGLGDALLDPGNPLSRTELGRQIVSGDVEMKRLTEIRDSNWDQHLDTRSIWQRQIAAANRFNDPGRFTTFIAYEWSAMPNYANLHRNVIFRGDDAPLPFGANDSDKPEDLWSYMESSRARGFENLAIPHNANVSDGLMYDWVQSDGRPIDEAYAQRRALNEPLSEIAQNKGTSETLPELSPDDPFAEFEIMRKLMLAAIPGKVPGSYVRDAMGRGLLIAKRTGANPYKFGFIGSTDAHSGLTTVREDQWGGHVSTIADVVTREVAAMSLMDNDPFFETVKGSAGALAVIWAESNTRASLFDAMRRRETYATSGTRIKMRMFAGWEFAEGDLGSDGWIGSAYDRGVPMGGDLAPRTDSRAPRFLLWAARDPESAGLDRMQIVKVWLDGDERLEKVIDIHVSDQPDGDAVIRQFWTDPDFDATQAAVYYMRVLERETPRWSTLLSERMDLPRPKTVPSHIQERAWSSPIWYSPTR